MKKCGFCLAVITYYNNGGDISTFDGKTGLAYHHKCVIEHLRSRQNQQ